MERQKPAVFPEAEIGEVGVGINEAWGHGFSPEVNDRGLSPNASGDRSLGPNLMDPSPLDRHCLDDGIPGIHGDDLAIG